MCWCEWGWNIVWGSALYTKELLGFATLLFYVPLFDAQVQNRKLSAQTSVLCELWWIIIW